MSITMTRLLLLLALMCENVNAAPQDNKASIWGSAPLRNAPSSGSLPNTSGPAGAAPFTLLHPLCQTGFTIAMRYDERNAAGTIIKSVWVRKCVMVPKIIYGGKI